MKKQKLDWLGYLNRLDLAAKIYRIARCVWELAAWLAEKARQPGS